MKNAKITQVKLAEKLGISQQLVSFWCSGRGEPKVSQLKEISRILKVDLETLVDCFEA